MRCAALHRKLGTHISKVKSLSMDTWSNEQVEVGINLPKGRCLLAFKLLTWLQHMRRIGNVASNRRFNPHNTKASIPLDVDEVDAAMERYIRQKYEQRYFTGDQPLDARHNTGSTSSEEPPPLPPKPTKRFAFGARAASSTFPTSSHARHGYNSPPTSPAPHQNGRAPSPVLRNKQSRVFGASVGSTGESLESKLARLREMGFPDDKRNASVLKGLNGSLERTVETLVKLGEGVTPQVAGFPAPSSINKPTLQKTEEAPVNGHSTNPFQRRATQPDLPQAALEAAAPSTAPSGTSIPSYNPFDNMPSQPVQQQSLEQSFRGLRVSQPLFPNATGGFPVSQAQYIHNPPPLTPPIPSIPQHFNYFASSQQPAAPQVQSQIHLQAQADSFSGNGTSPITNPSLSSSAAQASLNGNTPFSQEYVLQQQQPQLQPQPQRYPFQQQQSFQIDPYQQAFAPQMLQAQQTGRADKSSIMALYNYPQLAPAIPSATLNNTSPPINAESSAAPSSGPTMGNQSGQTQRSASTPAGLSAGTRNPFLTNGGSGLTGQLVAGTQPSRPNRHTSQESVDIGGWQSGRHSPDAFASLSARSVR